VPDHWHLTGKRTLDSGKEFVLRYLVRNGYEDREAADMRAAGYEVEFVLCNDLDHLHPAATPKWEQQ
jgi:hypothetical protein